MASVKKRPDGSWRARYRGPDGKERARHFGRKVDADRWLAGIEVAKTRGEWMSPELARITVAEWSEQWLAAQGHLKPSTRARYEGLLRRHVVPAFGPTRLGEVHHADVAAWVARLTTEGLAASTVRQAHRVLALVLGLAVRDGRLARNPADGVRLPHARVEEKRFLSHEEVERLANETGPYRTVVLVLAYCGLRFGEMAALRVRDVDLMRRRIEVRRAVSEVAGHLEISTPKSHQTRAVPVPRFLVEELAAQMAGRTPDDLAFPAPKDGILRNAVFRRHYFDAAANEAGFTGLTPHELRHTAASLAVSSGASVKVVQRMLGHASAAMTLDVYSGLFGDDLDSVADRLHEAKISSRADQLRTGEVVPLSTARSATP